MKFWGLGDGMESKIENKLKTIDLRKIGRRLPEAVRHSTSPETIKKASMVWNYSDSAPVVRDHG